MQEVDADLTALDRGIINAFQGGFPVTERPFEPAAAAPRARDRRDRPGAVRARARTRRGGDPLPVRGARQRRGDRRSGLARRDARPEDRYEEIAETVNEFTAVAHNYEREHPHLNMWFVVSVADHPDPDKDGSDRVDEVLAEIEAATGQETYNLPKVREFHVGAKFLVDGPVPDGEIDLSDLGPAVSASGRSTLTLDERDLVVEIQGGLPITEMPYADVAAAIGAEVDWVIETIKRFNAEGKVRRVGVIPNHYALGYTENGMTVWDVPEDALDEVGPVVARLDFVTHCYERPRHAGVWEYNFFAMTHGRTEAESERRIAEVKELMDEYWEVGESDWDTLFSTRILKKTGIRIADRADSNTA